jgi:hypothetical protein
MNLITNNTFQRMRILQILLTVTLLNSLVACDKFVDIDRPQNKLLTNEIFASDETALSGMYGIYSYMGRNQSGSGILVQSHSLTGLSGDELERGIFSESEEQFQKNSIVSSNSTLRGPWTDAYKVIYYANSMLEGLGTSASLSEKTKRQLMGECYFLRSLEYFYLINFFGNVPLILGTDYKVNYQMARTPVAAVYQQIEKDLELAAELLLNDYPVPQRIRPNRFAAKALLARVKLYVKDYAAAESLASELITEPRYLLETDLNKVFLVNSREAIWQIYPTDDTNYDTYIGSSFIPNNNKLPSYVLSKHLLNAFEPNDQRRVKWTGDLKVAGVDYVYSYKYKSRVKESTAPSSEYFTPLRLGEQYLIRAEARAMQNKIAQAMEDVNAIRQRAGLLPLTTVNTKEGALEAILQERRIELMVEFGHRWFDLKRTEKIDAVMSVVKGSLWQSTDALYPIFIQELTTAPNLTQNPGYQ